MASDIFLTINLQRQVASFYRATLSAGETHICVYMPKVNAFAQRQPIPFHAHDPSTGLGMAVYTQAVDTDIFMSHAGVHTACLGTSKRNKVALQLR